MNALQFQNNLLSIQENMLNFAMKLTGNRDDAIDLMQETSFKALKEQRKYKYDKSFNGWVLTMMRNIFLNDYNKLVREYTFIDHYVEVQNLFSWKRIEEYNPESDIYLKELKRAIHQLPNENRTPFRLFLSGYKYMEIGEILGLPIGTVKSRIFFARRKLRTSLEEYRSVV